MKILLIGSGKTGRAIATNLLELSYIKELNLFSRTLKSSEALAHHLDNSKISVIKDFSNLKDIDYIIIALTEMTNTARGESVAEN